MVINLWIDCKVQKFTPVKPPDINGRPIITVVLPYYTSTQLVHQSMAMTAQYMGDEVINIQIQLPEY